MKCFYDPQALFSLNDVYICPSIFNQLTLKDKGRRVYGRDEEERAEDDDANKFYDLKIREGKKK
jgi:hypothetical protein